MNFELPAAVGALDGSLVVGQPVVAAAGGPAFALVGLGRSWKQGQQARFDASPGSYLLRVDRGLRPRSLLARVRDPRRLAVRAARTPPQRLLLSLAARPIPGSGALAA
ncbi:hypothetical protein [Streptomyces inhibens]|uniref:hypothetical protein n=1 Tax=Streptomyces inhibens TaxID=2293571 RepID=UPI001EE6F616|nr:hypothetical protein [Streptomyces inhibens]UKY54658.1 hypothetical protein KI385_41585 [Streptomyces inhibens]